MAAGYVYLFRLGVMMSDEVEECPATRRMAERDRVRGDSASRLRYDVMTPLRLGLPLDDYDRRMILAEADRLRRLAGEEKE